MSTLQMFINNPLLINQNTNVYGSYINEGTSYDYTFSINLASFAGNISTIFNTASFTQNLINLEDVNIDLSINPSTTFANWTRFNNKRTVTLGLGQSNVAFATLQPTIPHSIGDRLLEVIAHKVFGHGQSRTAINNDSEFYTHDGELWNHLSNSISLPNIKHDIFNQYVGSGRYQSTAMNDLNVTDVNGSSVNFNFQGFTFDYPLFVAGNILTEASLTTDEVNLITNGPYVGGTSLVNGLYNIPILVSFHAYGTFIPAPPSAITSISIPLITPTGFTLSWSGGIAGGPEVTTTFTINGDSVIPATSDVVGTATFSGLIDSTWLLVITATNDVGVQSASTTILANYAPSVITDILISSITSTGFTAAWSGGTSTFKTVTISYKINNTIITPTLSDIGTATFALTGNSSPWILIIIATNTAGIVSSTDTTISAPSAITNITAAWITSKTFTVGWSGGTSIYPSVTSSFNINGVATTPLNSGIGWADFSLSSDSPSPWLLIITATNDVGSVNSTSVTIGKPSAITGISTSSITNTGFKVNWSGGISIGPTVATTYTINNFTATPTTSGIGTATFSSLTGSSWVLIITAYNTIGSAISASTTLIKPSAITNISTSSITNTGFKVDWLGGSSINQTVISSYTINGSSTTPITSDIGTATFGSLTGPIWNLIITATNALGSVISTTTTLAAPSAITVITTSSITSSGFTIGWSGGVSTYPIGTTSYTINNLPVTPTTSGVGIATFSSLTGLSWTLIITATNAVGLVTSTTVFDKPSAITGITTSSITSTGFIVGWSGGTSIAPVTTTFTINGKSVAPMHSEGMATFNSLIGPSWTLIITATNIFGSVTSTSTTFAAPSAITDVVASTVLTTSFQASWSGGTSTYPIVTTTYTINDLPATPSISSTGLEFKILEGYHNENADFANLAGAKGGLGATTSGVTSIIDSLSTGTSKIIQGTTWGGEGVAAHNFTVYWYGFFYTGNNPTGDWTFWTDSDDGSYLWVDSQLVVSNGSAHAMVEKSGVITLNTNQYYPIKILFGEIGGGFDMRVSFQGPNVGRRTDGNGFYFSKSQPAGTTIFSGLTGPSWALIIIATNAIGSVTSTSMTILAQYIPPAITDVTTSLITSTGFTVGWIGGTSGTTTIPTAITTYKINGSLVTPTTSDIGTATFSSLTGLSWVLIITATNYVGLVNSASTTMAAPSTITGISTSSINSTGFTANWSGGISTYPIVITSFTINDSSVTPTASDIGMATFDSLPGRSWILIITATNDMGSVMRTSTTISAPSVITDVVTSTVLTTSFNVSWSGGTSTYPSVTTTYTINDLPATPSTSSAGTAIFSELTGPSWALIIIATNAVGSVTSTSMTILAQYIPPAITDVTTSLITSTGFTVGWTGGTSGTETIPPAITTYKINGSLVTPTTSDVGTATFSSLTGLSWILIITATNYVGLVNSTSTSIAAPSTITGISTSLITSTGFTANWSGGISAYPIVITSFTINDSSVTPITSDTGMATFDSLIGTSWILIITATNDVGSVMRTSTTISAPSAIIDVVTSSVLTTSFNVSWSGGTSTYPSVTTTYTINDLPATPSTSSAGTAIFSELTGPSWALIIIATNAVGSVTSIVVNMLAQYIPPAIIDVTTSEITSSGFTANWYGGISGTDTIPTATTTYTINGLTVIPTISLLPTTLNSGTVTDVGTVTFSSLTGSNWILIITATNYVGHVSSPSITVALPSLITNILSSFVTSVGFTVNWTGGISINPIVTTSYTINGLVAIPTLSDIGTATFDSLTDNPWELIITATNDVGLISASTILSAPSTITNLSTSSVNGTGFIVNWSGGTAMLPLVTTSYTINDITVIPTISKTGTATFNSLTGSTWTLIITATNDLGLITSTSTTILAQYIPSVITDVLTSSITSTGFMASWIGGTGGTVSIPSVTTSYTINGMLTIPITSDIGTATFNLLAGSSWTLIIKATNIIGSVTSASTIITAPSSINNLNISSINVAGFTVNWSGGTSAYPMVTTSFTINGSPVTPTTSGTGIATFSSLPNISWLLIIIATNDVGSVSSSSTTIGIPSAITDILIPSSTTTGFTANWSGGISQGPTVTTSYTINGVTIIPVSSGTRTATFNNLTGTSWIFIITASNSFGSVNTSITLSKPSAITSISTSSVTDTSFTASWSGGISLISSTTTYKINNISVIPTISDIGTASFSSLTGTSWILIITITNGCGTVTGTSASIKAMYPPSAITNILIPSRASTSFSATWSGGTSINPTVTRSYSINGVTTTPTSSGTGSAAFSLLTGLSWILIIYATNTVGTVTSESITILAAYAPTSITSILTSSITNTGFTASWSGGTSPSLYPIVTTSYKINNLAVTPTTSDIGTATFNSLTGSSWALIITATNTSGSQTKSITLTAPSAITNLVISSITDSITGTNTGFTATWSGGISTYPTVTISYTINDSPVTPITSGTGTATFPGLIGTRWILIITATNGFTVTTSTIIDTNLLSWVKFNGPGDVASNMYSDTIDPTTGSAWWNNSKTLIYDYALNRFGVACNGLRDVYNYTAFWMVNSNSINYLRVTSGSLSTAHDSPIFQYAYRGVNYTVAYWFKITCVTTINFRVRIADAFLEFTNEYIGQYINTMYCYSGTGSLYSQMPDCINNGWHHIAFTIIGNNNYFNLYYDGNLIWTSGRRSFTPASYSNRLSVIFQSPNVNTGTVDLHDYRLYPYALSSADVYSVYSQLAGQMV
jgi:hypothetical protein